MRIQPRLSFLLVLNEASFAVPYFYINMANFPPLLQTIVTLCSGQCDILKTLIALE